MDDCQTIWTPIRCQHLAASDFGLHRSSRLSQVLWLNMVAFSPKWLIGVCPVSPQEVPTLFTLSIGTPYYSCSKIWKKVKFTTCWWVKMSVGWVATTADPDQMLHFAVSDLSLYWLLRPVPVFSIIMVMLNQYLKCSFFFFLFFFFLKDATVP